MSAPLSERLRAAYGSSLWALSSRQVADQRPRSGELPGREIDTEAGTCLLHEER